MALDPRFVASLDLEPLLIDRDTGQPLTNGQIRFFQDTARNVPKLVYQLVNLGGAPPNYGFQALPNPVQLSAFGTIQDNAGNNIALYYFPFDGLPATSANTTDLYYVEVYNSAGVLQFTREAWPPNAQAGGGGGIGGGNDFNNELSNPQFAQILFLPNNPLTITIGGAGTFTYEIAPKWSLVVTAAAATTVTILRTSIAGTAALPSNPPYTLTVTPGANITSLVLRQRLFNNPNIWAPAAPNAANGYLNASILLAPGSAVTMQYQPNGTVVQTVLMANNVSLAYTQYSATVQLLPDNNATTSDTGFVDILLVLSNTLGTTFSNVQVVPLSSNIATVGYDQTPVNRQVDQLFNYYSPLLNYKAISSYLVGWDFPSNPVQFLGPTLAASAAGVNTSRYVWDQTIVFQTTNNGPAISKGTNGALRITATNASQFALIQYLPQTVAREILNSRISVNIAALTSVVAGLGGTVSLWYTTDANLPSTAANNSIVLTLDANGKPATFNGNWTEVPRSNLGNARFTVATSATTNFNDYPLMGWDALGVVGVNTATFFAIVVGFAQLPITQTIDFGSISLVPGDIATRPAPQAKDEVLRECQYYYEKSFNQGVIPAQNIGFGFGELQFPTPTWFGVAPFYLVAVPFKVTKNIVPPTVTLYNPNAANALVVEARTFADIVGSIAANINQTGFAITCTTTAAIVSGDPGAVYWSADSRLGL